MSDFGRVNKGGRVRLGLGHIVIVLCYRVVKASYICVEVDEGAVVWGQ